MKKTTLADFSKKPDALDKLSLELFGRTANPQDWLGGSNAIILTAATAEIRRLRQQINAIPTTQQAVDSEKSCENCLWFNINNQTYSNECYSCKSCKRYQADLFTPRDASRS